jgi:hypothetical protein
LASGTRQSVGGTGIVRGQDHEIRHPFAQGSHHGGGRSQPATVSNAGHVALIEDVYVVGEIADH